MYREISLDLTRTSHVRLLRRIAQPGSQLPGLIRKLEFYDIQERHASFLPEICALVSGLKYLAKFSWSNGSLDMPQCILDELHARISPSEIVITATRAHFHSPDEVGQTLPVAFQSTLTHSAASVLTRFEFEQVNKGQLYEGFKKDFVTLLFRATHLKVLHMILWYDDDTTYPEMLEELRINELPRLHELVFYRGTMGIFTLRKLAIWGRKGGWDDLVTLKLNSAQSLTLFVGRTPKLSTLTLFPKSGDDYDHLEAFLDDFKAQHSFGLLRNICYRCYTTYRDQPAARDHRIVPWCILKNAPNIKYLIISRPYFGSAPGPSLDTPDAQDVTAIRNLCQNLETLHIDISLEGIYSKWPLDVLEQLASFDGDIKLELYLHCENSRRTAFMVNRLELHAIMRHIRRQRTRLDLPLYKPFQVWFKIVRLSNDTNTHWSPMDFRGRISKRNKTCIRSIDWSGPEPIPDRMSVEELTAEETKGICGKLGIDWHGYGREIQRRKKHEVEIGRFAADATLYDLLIGT